MPIALFSIQILFTVIVSILLVYAISWDSGISAFLGGFICIVPGLIFAMITLRKQKHPRIIIQQFYWGEVLKLILCFILFVLAFQWKGLQPFPMFLVFIVIQLTYWLAPWINFFKNDVH